MWLLRLAWLLLLSPLYASDGFPYELSICAIFRDEAPYLKEWLEFHKLIGVERFYLFNNGSTDDYLTVLQAYIDQNEVELIDWPSPAGEDWTPYQESAYQLCLEATQGITKWLAFLDIDEFIVPLRDNSLIEFLREHEEHAIVIAYWRIFGTSYLAEIPPNTLLTECLTRTHPPLSQGELCFGKPIAKPHLVNYINIHSGHSNSRSTYYCHPGYAHNWNRGKVTATAPELRINHYWTRDEKFLFSTKQERRERYEGKPWSPEK